MKERFIKKALILALGGFITKILSMVIRIITTRVIGVDGLGLYMLVLPTFNLFITIATLSLPTAISKLVAEGTRNNKKLVLGFLPIAIIFNIFLIIIIIIFVLLVSYYFSRSFVSLPSQKMLFGNKPALIQVV